jgi:hypothetical protein
LSVGLAVAGFVRRIVERLRDRPVATVVWVAASVQLALMFWAWGRFPAIADGSFYRTLGDRLAAGHGYTWAWPDGAVTPVAHYPVGLPALYALSRVGFGPVDGVAMVPVALVGTVAAAAVTDSARRAASARVALVVGLSYALHPALLLYLPALMTEGVSAHLVAILLWASTRGRPGVETGRARLVRVAVVGGLVGLAAYVRPQALLLVPLAMVPSFCHVAPVRQRLRDAALDAALAGSIAFAVLLPWALRNQERMGAFTLVSLNGGWNLLIGTDPSARGTWAPLQLPPRCVGVFDEAAKDRCFRDAAWGVIRSQPLQWLALVPKKLAVTFDHFSAGPAYLHDASPATFGSSAKRIASVVEFGWHRALVAIGLFGLTPSRSPRLRALVAALACIPAGWIATLVLAALAMARGWGGAIESSRRAALASGFVLATTAIVHAVFFGAGRYGLVSISAVSLLASLRSARWGFDSADRPRHS